MPVCVQVCAYLCVCAVVRMPVVYMCVFLKLIQHSRWQRNWQYKETLLEAGTRVDIHVKQTTDYL